MTDQRSFEARLSAAFEAYASEAPVEIDAVELAATIARPGGQAYLRRTLGYGLRLALSAGVAAGLVVLTVVIVNLRGLISSEAVGLPDTPDAWSRVPIAAVDGEGGVLSLAAGPRGLVAIAGEEAAPYLVASADGRDWRRVPAEQHPPLGSVGAAVIGTESGFMMVGTEVWTSDDGFAWRRLVGAGEDPDLEGGRMLAAAVGGPGYVAVGTDNMAWFSTDGVDWRRATVPPPPPAPSLNGREVPWQTVSRLGVATAGRQLVSWGTAATTTAEGWYTEQEVLWASSDGLSWTDVTDDAKFSPMGRLAGGPHGFIAIDNATPWLSLDGRRWDAVGSDAFASRWPDAADGSRGDSQVASVAAGVAGYVVIGADGLCGELGDCSALEPVLWTSPDGRSWARMSFGAVERGPGVTRRHEVVVAWGSGFVIGGEHEGRPTVWISDAAPGAKGDGQVAGVAGATLAPTAETGVGAHVGSWAATDADGSQLAMEIADQPDGTYSVLVRDDRAAVCDGAPSTMTGTGVASEDGQLVIAQPRLTCEDGSEPEELSGPPLDEQLEDLEFSYDFYRDELRDSFGLIWRRVRATP